MMQAAGYGDGSLNLYKRGINIEKIKRIRKKDRLSVS